MRKRLKKLVAVAIVGATLCGTMITTHAASHTCDSYMTFVGTIRSVNTTHQYVQAVNRDYNGNVVGYVYGNCTVTTYLDKYNYVCKHCGAVTGSTTKTRVGHSVNH